MGLGGIVSGLIGGGQKLPTIDISQLMATIKNAGQYQQTIINALPAEIQKQIAAYKQQMDQGGTAYQEGIASAGNALTAGAASIYGPNSAAATAENNANKTQIYSTVPGSQDAIREAMAATGGLGRGNAGAALAAPVVNAAQGYATAAAGVNAKQTQQAQSAQMSALQTVTNMNEQMFTQMFGMTKQQATQILTSGNQALQDQLAELIAQSNNQTNQTLSAQGIAANNGYQNAVTRNAQQAQIWNGVADLGLQGIQAGMGMPSMGGGSSLAGMV